MEAADVGVAVGQGGDVRPHQGGDGGHEEQDAADGLGAQCVGHEPALGEREPAEELAAGLLVGGVGRGHVGTSGVGWTA